MGYISFNDILERFSKSGMNVFTVHDAAMAMQKSTAYTSLILSRNKKLSRITKGIYYTVGAGMYEIASKIVYPSYVSLLAALQYYDLIDQNILKYSVITTKRHRPIALKNGGIDFITLNKSRVFGYSYRNNAYVATIEKMFIDCLYLNSPDFIQVESSFAAALQDHKINVDKMKAFGIKMGSKSLINKLGFMLENSGIAAADLLKLTYRAKYTKIKGNLHGRSSRWMVE